MTSFVLGNLKCGVLPLIHSMDGVVTLNVSSDSGGREFLGTIPGSLQDVNKRKVKSCIIHQRCLLICLNTGRKIEVLQLYNISNWFNHHLPKAWWLSSQLILENQEYGCDHRHRSLHVGLSWRAYNFFELFGKKIILLDRLWEAWIETVILHPDRISVSLHRKISD